MPGCDLPVILTPSDKHGRHRLPTQFCLMLLVWYPCTRCSGSTQGRTTRLRQTTMHHPRTMPSLPLPPVSIRQLTHHQTSHGQSPPLNCTAYPQRRFPPNRVMMHSIRCRHRQCLRPWRKYSCTGGVLGVRRNDRIDRGNGHTTHCQRLRELLLLLLLGRTEVQQAPVCLTPGCLEILGPTAQEA